MFIYILTIIIKYLNDMFGIRDCKIIRASLYSSVGEINQDFRFCALNAKRGGNCIIVIVDNSKCHYNVKKNHWSLNVTVKNIICCCYYEPYQKLYMVGYYTPRNKVVGGYIGFTMSVRPSVCRQILCRTITWVMFLKLESFKILSAVYWWREEDPFHFWWFLLLPFQSYWTWYDGK